MHGRDDQAAEIKAEDGNLDDDSSGSDGKVPGELPAEKNVGDVKPHGL